MPRAWTDYENMHREWTEHEKLTAVTIDLWWPEYMEQRMAREMRGSELTGGQIEAVNRVSALTGELFALLKPYDSDFECYRLLLKLRLAAIKAVYLECVKEGS